MDHTVKALEEIIHLEPNKYIPYYVDRQLATLWSDITKNKSIRTMNKFKQMLSHLADHQLYYESKMERMTIALKKSVKAGKDVHKAACIKAAKTMIWVHVLNKFIKVFKKNEQNIRTLQEKHPAENELYMSALKSKVMDVTPAEYAKFVQFKRKILRCVRMALHPLNIPPHHGFRTVSILDPPRAVRLHLLRAAAAHNWSVYCEHKFNRQMMKCKIEAQAQAQADVQETQDEVEGEDDGEEEDATDAADMDMDDMNLNLDMDDTEDEMDFDPFLGVQMQVATEVEVQTERDQDVDLYNESYEVAEAEFFSGAVYTEL